MKSQLGYLEVVEPPAILDSATSQDQVILNRSVNQWSCEVSGSRKSVWPSVGQLAKRGGSINQKSCYRIRRLTPPHHFDPPPYRVVRLISPSSGCEGGGGCGASMQGRGTPGSQDQMEERGWRGHQAGGGWEALIFSKKISLTLSFGWKYISIVFRLNRWHGFRPNCIFAGSNIKTPSQ